MNDNRINKHVMMKIREVGWMNGMWGLWQT